VDADLGEDRLEVALHGVRRHEQATRDVGSAAALQDELDHRVVIVRKIGQFGDLGAGCGRVLGREARLHQRRGIYRVPAGCIAGQGAGQDPAGFCEEIR
jgi:hypothetical protein